MIFAAVFIIARVFLTPIFLLYMFEGYNVLYSIKLGVCIILYVQLMWAYRIVELVFESIRQSYEKKEKTVPKLVLWAQSAMINVQKDKKTKMSVALFNFVWIFVVPHIYYGYVLKNLHFNLVW